MGFLQQGFTVSSIVDSTIDSIVESIECSIVDSKVDAVAATSLPHCPSESMPDALQYGARALGEL